MVCDTPQSPDAFTHKIWNSYPKEYKRYAPDSMLLQEARSEVKVTVTQLWYATLQHSHAHTHTHQIWDSYLNLYMIYTPDTILLKTITEVKVTVTPKWYATLRHPMMHPHIKFAIPTSKGIEDMHRTRSGTDGPTLSKLDTSWVLTVLEKVAKKA